MSDKQFSEFVSKTLTELKELQELSPEDRDWVIDWFSVDVRPPLMKEIVLALHNSMISLSQNEIEEIIGQELPNMWQRPFYKNELIEHLGTERYKKYLLTFKGHAIAESFLDEV